MGKLNWIDIGVNLTDSSFDKDRNDVIEQAFANGIEQLVITGTSLKESIEAIALCQQYPEHLFCTVGVHPHYAKDHQKADINELLALSSEPCVVAIGEMGLDFNRNFSEPSQQITIFEQQLEIASNAQLPLFLHERDAHKQQLEMLSSHRDDFTHAVAHCFTGSKEELYNYLDLDLHIGITGWVCDERRGISLQKLLKEIPPNRLMIETDAPYLLPRDLKPKPKSRRNTPSNLPHIADKIANLLNKDLAQLNDEIQKNTRSFFKLPPPNH